MSDLQLSLLAASGVAIVCVFAYNKWQEWRHRNAAQAVFADEQPDVLMGQNETPTSAYDESDKSEDRDPTPVLVSAIDAEKDDRREPSLMVQHHDEISERVEPTIQFQSAIAEIPSAPAPSFADLNVEPPVLDAPMASTRVPVVLPPISHDLLNPDCDALIALELGSGIRPDAILSAQQAVQGKVSKPVFWLGLNAENQWQVLSNESNGLFKHLRLVVQLANRLGPIGETELYTLHHAAQEMSTEWNAVMDASDLESALSRARQLDQFCVEVDLQIGINLTGSVPFPGTKIRALAEAAGMSLNWQGAFEKQDDEGRTLFTLSNQEPNVFATDSLRTLKTNGLTFILDVPRVGDTGFVFDHMLRLAKQFSEALQARIVDDNRRPLTDAQLFNIREQFVVKPQADMAAKRIPAGSSLALRLFA
jgi:FtsZ-interacting cell division protein ZipA